MKKGIYLSIKPEYVKRIISGAKNYEFRNYYPKENIDLIYVYVTRPVCSLKYIIELGDIIKYPNKISKDGYGNLDFNRGLKTKYAYEIDRVYLLKDPISLKELRDKYNFTPPQGYAYDNRYSILTNRINNSDFIRVI